MGTRLSSWRRCQQVAQLHPPSGPSRRPSPGDPPVLGCEGLAISAQPGTALRATSAPQLPGGQLTCPLPPPQQTPTCQHHPRAGFPGAQPATGLQPRPCHLHSHAHVSPPPSPLSCPHASRTTDISSFKAVLSELFPAHRQRENGMMNTCAPLHSFIRSQPNVTFVQMWFFLRNKAPPIQSRPPVYPFQSFPSPPLLTVSHHQFGVSPSRVCFSTFNTALCIHKQYAVLCFRFSIFM